MNMEKGKKNTSGYLSVIIDGRAGWLNAT